jgi:hypothetical protein
MTTLLEQAVHAARDLPANMQDAVARMMMLFTGNATAGNTTDYVDLTEEDESAVLRSKAASERGEFASNDRMNAIWAKYN